MDEISRLREACDAAADRFEREGEIDRAWRLRGLGDTLEAVLAGGRGRGVELPEAYEEGAVLGMWLLEGSTFEAANRRVGETRNRVELSDPSPGAFAVLGPLQLAREVLLSDPASVGRAVKRIYVLYLDPATFSCMHPDKLAGLNPP